MAKPRQKIWTYRAPTPRPMKASEAERARIVTACDALIRDVLTPRYLAEVKPTAFNYPVALFGDWRAGRYRFIQRFRSGFPDNAGEEFDSPFARLDLMGPDRFDIHWMRHTGQWWKLHTGLSLAEALDRLEHHGILHPIPT